MRFLYFAVLFTLSYWLINLIAKKLLRNNSSFKKNSSPERDAAIKSLKEVFSSDDKSIN